LSGKLPLPYPILCFKEIRVFAKIRILSSATVSQTQVKNFTITISLVQLMTITSLSHSVSIFVYNAVGMIQLIKQIHLQQLKRVVIITIITYTERN